MYSGKEGNAINKSIRWLAIWGQTKMPQWWPNCKESVNILKMTESSCSSTKPYLEGMSTPQPICDKNCSFAGGEWNVSQRGVVCVAYVSLLVFWASILWRVGEADTDMVSLPLAEPGPAADSRFYLMWTSRVGFQSWLQHMISIMTRGGTHAGGWLVTMGRQERGGVGG